MRSSTYIYVLVTLVAYQIGLLVKKKTNINALLVAIVLVMGFVSIFGIDVSVYQAGTTYISYLLTPATICLAIPLYEQFERLKENWLAIIVGIISGVLASLVSISTLSMLFHLSKQETISLLPKSITTAIGMGVSEELGGMVSLTVGAIILTGVLGAVIAPMILKIAHIQHPVAKGIAIGCAAHAIGTSKAMELGEVEGAMSSLSIVLSGLLTVILMPLFIG